MEIAESKTELFFLDRRGMMNGNTPKNASKEPFPTPMAVRNKDDLSKVAKIVVSLG